MARAFRPTRARLFVLASLAVAIAASGCASFRGGPLPKIKDLPRRAAAKPSVKVQLTFSEPGRDRSLEKQRRRSEKMQAELVRVLSESGYFSRVAPDILDADLIVDASLRVDSVQEGDGELAGLTFGLIPEKTATVKYKFEASVTSSRLHHGWTVTLEDCYAKWIHLFLLPVIPFKLESVVAHGVRTDVFRNFTLALHERGILDAATSDVAEVSQGPALAEP